MKLSLPTQILIAIVLGIVCGLFFGDLMQWAQPVGEAWVMLLKMAILPYITLALIYGIGSLQPKQALRLLKYGGFFLVLMWVVVIATMYLFTLAFPKTISPYNYATLPEDTHVRESLLKLFIPSNPFYSLTFNIVPSVVIFSVIFGVALMHIPGKDNVLRLFSTGISALSRIIKWVVNLSQIGVFALIGSTVGTIPLGQFQKLEIYLLAFIIITAFLTIWILPALITTFTKVKYREFFKAMRAPVLLAFATGNIFVALPSLMEGMTALSKRHGFYTEDSEAISKAIVPVAYNLPLVGNLMAMFFVLFLDFFFSLDLSIFDNVRLVFLGILSLAGPVNAGPNAISFLLEALRMPFDGVNIFAETFGVTRFFQGLAGTMGIATFTTLTLFAFARKAHFSFLRASANVVVTVIGFFVLIGALVWVDPQPKPDKPVWDYLSIVAPPVATVYREDSAAAETPKRDPKKPLLEQIIQSGVLRVGYNPVAMPFAYFNAQDDLVGFDIAYAYDLAATLGVELVFVPFTYGTLVDDLENYRYDIAMSAVTATVPRLREMSFSSPVVDVENVFVVPDYLASQFADLQKVIAWKGLRIAVSKGSTQQSLAEEMFPDAIIVPILDPDEILHGVDVDAILWTNYEGLTWSLMHPSYTIARTRPKVRKVVYAYAMPLNSPELLSHVNYWLSLRAVDGFHDREYQKWVLGKTGDPPRRWSIIRNVLGW